MGTPTTITGCSPRSSKRWITGWRRSRTASTSATGRSLWASAAELLEYQSGSLAPFAFGVEQARFAARGALAGRR